MGEKKEEDEKREREKKTTTELRKVLLIIQSSFTESVNYTIYSWAFQQIGSVLKLR